MTRHALSPGFWERFAERCWEKKPLVLKRPFAARLVTPRQVFRILAGADSTNRTDWGFRLYVGQALRESGIARYLPAPDDGSLSGYAERVVRALESRRFALVVDHDHKHDAETWLRLRDFLDGLYRVVGIPVPMGLGAVSVSRNERSLFGIHKGRHGDFTFVVEGRKRILAWPDEAFRDRPDVEGRLDHGRLSRKAIRLEGRPGDLIYWPSGYRHAAESVGGFSVTLPVPVYPELDGGSEIFRHVTRAVESRLRATEGARLHSSRPDRLQKSAGNAPRLVAAVSKALRETSRSGELGREAQVAWLGRVTSCGFASLPAPLPYRAQKDDDVVRGEPRHPVVWRPAGRDEIACSANGHSFSICAHPGVAKLLKRVNRGRRSASAASWRGTRASPGEPASCSRPCRRTFARSWRSSWPSGRSPSIVGPPHAGRVAGPTFRASPPVEGCRPGNACLASLETEIVRRRKPAQRPAPSR